MKKNIKMYMIISLLSGTLILSCHSGKDKTVNETSTTNKDTAVAANIANIVNDSAVNSPAVKPDPATKEKKGKVSGVLLTNENKNNSNIAGDNETANKNSETFPAFPGGQQALDKFIAENVVYPQEALNNGTEGTVIVNFAVDKKGMIYTPHVVSDKIGDGLEVEAMKVINKMPLWTPGRIKGKNVITHYSLPIRFQISE